MEILDADALAFLWNAQSSWQIFDVFDVELSATTGIDPWPHPRQLPPAARQHEIPVNFQWWLWQAPEDWWKLGWYLAFPASLSLTEFAADHYWRLRLNGSMNGVGRCSLCRVRSSITFFWTLGLPPDIHWSIIQDPRSIWIHLARWKTISKNPNRTLDAPFLPFRTWQRSPAVPLDRWRGPSSGASILRRTSIILSFFRSWIKLDQSRINPTGSRDIPRYPTT